jgi:hypothetical protein
LHRHARLPLSSSIWRRRKRATSSSSEGDLTRRSHRLPGTAFSILTSADVSGASSACCRRGGSHRVLPRGSPPARARVRGPPRASERCRRRPLGSEKESDWCENETNLVRIDILESVGAPKPIKERTFRSGPSFCKDILNQLHRTFGTVSATIIRGGQLVPRINPQGVCFNHVSNHNRVG